MSALPEKVQIKLTGVGMETYTGMIAKVKFTDGLSEEIPLRLALSVGAVREAVFYRDGLPGAPANPALLAAVFATTRQEQPRETVAAPQKRTDAEPFYIKTITSIAPREGIPEGQSVYFLTAADHGYLLDFKLGVPTAVAVTKDLPADFYCTLRQGDDSPFLVGADKDVSVEEIDGNFVSEKRLAILSLARFPDGSFQLSGRTISEGAL